MTLVRLRKWYLDLVTADGTAAILYVARLGLGRLTVGYQSLLLSRPGEAPTTVTRFGAPMEPVRDGARMTWEAGRLGVTGQWTALAPAVRRLVLERPSGSVDWDCVMPAARVELDVGGETLRGLGYAEVLEVTLPPWELPIHTLRWGRFVGEGTQAVWIDWQGPHTFACVVVDGEDVPDARVEDAGLALGSTTLRLDQGRVLREGALGQTALARLPPRVARTLPARALGLHEKKWLSRGALERPGRAPVDGWAIHEVVVWP